MATSTAPVKISFDEYLELEAAAKFKSEYRSGEVFAMAGGTPAHSELQGSIISLLRQNKPKGCRVFTADLKIFAPAVNEGLYPDASLVCGDLEFYPGRQDVILNPMLVVEVLSPSTRDYDLGMKASFYRTIPSLATLLFVDSERRWVQRQTRQSHGSNPGSNPGHQWSLTEFADPGQTVWTDGNHHITIADIYHEILA
jgi:Uma2 family endonuclease